VEIKAEMAAVLESNLKMEKNSEVFRKTSSEAIHLHFSTEALSAPMVNETSNGKSRNELKSE
jgi:hypothetical protein